MGNHDILAIGTSAGGVAALRFLAKSFALDLPASVLVTIHLSPRFPSSLDRMLNGTGPLPASFARDGERPRPGHIYIAPPGSHLLHDGERLVLGAGARENHVRPSIDPMLRSVAVCCAHRAVGAVLTGTLNDGASGLSALRKCGGITVVQDPSDAVYGEMPSAALDRACPNHVAPLDQLPALLDRLVREPQVETRPAPERLRYEVELARSGNSTIDDMDRIGRRSVFSCPECGGAVWEVDEDELVRYRCHTGHAHTAELMRLALDENLGRALAVARRGYEERRALLSSMEERARRAGHRELTETWREQAEECRRQEAVIDDATDRLECLAAEADRS